MNQRGSLSIAAATGALVFCLFALAAADLGVMVHARARAQAAAEAAALAAAVNQAPILGQGDDPETAAREQASIDGATVVACDCEVGRPSATVTVETHPRPVLVGAWMSRPVRATATAEVDPDVFSYRDAE